MKQKFTFLVFLVFISCFKLKSQVNLQTGSAQFSIPLYSYTDPNNRIGTSISLTYINGGGLKVSEMASSVGTGWALNFGGCITRLQRGEPDDQKRNQNYEYYRGWNDPMISYNYLEYHYPNGYMYSDYHPSIPVDWGCGYTRLYRAPFKFKAKPQYLEDREQDVFAFNFNGRTGEFRIGKDGEIRTTVDSKLRITKVLSDMTGNNVRTTISEFHVTDEQGTQYIFKDLELSDVLTYDDVRDQAGNPVKVYWDYVPAEWTPPSCSWPSCKQIALGKSTGKYIVSKWYLSEIVNPFTNAKITFKYQDYNIDINSELSFQKTLTGGKAQSSLTWLKVKGIGKRITSIEPASAERIDFQYAQTPRLDLPYDRELTKIKISIGGKQLYSWNFSFKYSFNSSLVNSDYLSSSQNGYARLYLESLQKKGGYGKEESPYQFSYYIGNDDKVPAMFDYNHDHWGYWNETQHCFFTPGQDPAIAVNNGHYERAVNDPTLIRAINPNKARNGILKTVQYPLGGSLTFEYEQNKALDNSSVEVFVGGVRVNKTIVQDGINTNNNVVTEYKYQKENNLSSGWGYEAPIYAQTNEVSISAYGDYTCMGIQVGQAASQLPGAYIKAASAGVIMSVANLATNFIFSLVLNVAVKEIIEAFSDSYNDYSSVVTRSTPINWNNGLPLQYSRVEVIPKTLNSSNGRTVYEFTSKEHVALYRSTAAFPYSHAPRYAYWVYGLPKITSVYDNNNQLIKKTVHEYQYIVNNLVDGDFISQKWAANKSMFNRYDITDGMTSTAEEQVVHDFYYPLTGRTELIETQEFTFNNLGASTLNTISFEYSPHNYQINKTKTTNSKGEGVESYTYYPTDYNIAGALQTLKDNNVINLPVAMQSVHVKGNDSYVVDGTVSEYGLIGNGDIKMVKKLSLQSTEPVPKSTVNFSPISLIPNNQYYKEQQQTKYNSVGLPAGTFAKGKKAGKLYGYNNRLIIADVVNASGDEAFFDPFEEGGTWEGITYDYMKSHTGDFSAKINNLTEAAIRYKTNKPISISLTQDTKFKLSGWIYNQYSASGTIVVLMSDAQNNSYGAGGFARTIHKDKWVYVENEFVVPAHITNLTVRLDNDGGSVPGTNWFDDIRLHPSSASMTTYTYDPGVGVTSQTDANNRVLFYQYDGLGRKELEKDEHSNILKKYCYNYVGQQETCPVLTIGNVAKSKVFRKSNCDPALGKYGAEVTYTVPANKYLSFSQPAADALAEHDLHNFGQAYANEFGGCHQGEANDLRSGVFTTSCTLGKIGSQVTYEVQSGKHAAVDKAAANALAEADRDNNGQAYANANGTCLYYNSAINANYYSQDCSSAQTPIAYNVVVPAGEFSSSLYQDYADFQAQSFAQQQANQYGTCANGATTVYARLEVAVTTDQTSQENYGDVDAYLYKKEVEMYLRFYSDAACTIPYTLTSPIQYVIDNSGYFETEVGTTPHGGSAYSGTAPAGSSFIFFDNILSFEGRTDWYDNSTQVWTHEKWRDDYQLTSVSTGCVISTPVYPNHGLEY